MTKDEAIAWAVANMAEAFQYEYYTDEALANKAAQAMSLLDTKPWRVTKRDPSLGEGFILIHD